MEVGLGDEKESRLWLAITSCYNARQFSCRSYALYAFSMVFLSLCCWSKWTADRPTRLTALLACLGRYLYSKLRHVNKTQPLIAHGKFVLQENSVQ